MDRQHGRQQSGRQHGGTEGAVHEQPLEATGLSGNETAPRRLSATDDQIDSYIRMKRQLDVTDAQLKRAIA